jgi:folate-binding protein YgfZ
MRGTEVNAELPQWFVSLGSSQSSVTFPPYAEQCRALQGAAVISPLSFFSLIKVTGEDAQGFLQGQLSSDVRELDGSKAQYSSYSTAKGRLLASFLLWKGTDDYFMLVASDIAVAVVKRLSMFIMRSHVKMALCEDFSLLGAKGSEVERWLSAGLSSLPAASLDLILPEDGSMCVRLPSGALLLALANADTAPARLGPVPAPVVAVNAEAWSLLDITAGIGWITQPTQEMFVAQMLNMDVVGAVSFSKGCYPGQEIIARTRYLGKVKRRMELVQLPCAANSGDLLYSPAVAGQSIGALVNVTQNAEGDYLALAVAQTPCWDDGVFLEKENIRKLKKLSLPYAVSDE